MGKEWEKSLKREKKKITDAPQKQAYPPTCSARLRGCLHALKKRRSGRNMLPPSPFLFTCHHTRQSQTRSAVSATFIPRTG